MFGVITWFETEALNLLQTLTRKKSGIKKQITFRKSSKSIKLKQK